MRNEYTANASLRSEAYVNESLHSAATERQRVAAVLSGSKAVQRQRYQKVANKQHTGLLFCVMLAASAFTGCLLAY